ncbi:MbeB family mobilization protein [Escherichia coli]|uniref:MbeB family mobilization protein n=1 Tax=Escherichia coli TaxID=562 RepID=UPI001CD0051B|nr:MbeB family mobilization protein [Escherichia coli]UBO58520.1 hypothetical protein LCE25_25545 [Escherichia coli]
MLNDEFRKLEESVNRELTSNESLIRNAINDHTTALKELLERYQKTTVDTMDALENRTENERETRLRPDTPKVNGLTRPGGSLSAPGIRSQTSCDRLRELHVSAVFTVIPEACEATA